MSTVPGRKLDPPRADLLRVVATSGDRELARVVNKLVAAVIELQTCVYELQDEVKKLKADGD